MKVLLQFLIALVMMIQGMQVAVAGANVTAGAPQTSPEPLDPAIKTFFNALLMASDKSTAGQTARAEIEQSVTRPRLAYVLPLGTAGGLVNAKWRTFPNAAEAEKGLKHGMSMIVSSESPKLTKRQRAELQTTPRLTRYLFPGSVNGAPPPEKSVRVTYQAGKPLNFSGKVAAGVRKRSTVVLEGAKKLSDGTLGPWITLQTLVPDLKGRFSHDMEVGRGFQSVRARLEVKSKSAKMTGGTGMTSTPVPPSGMPFNTFGITTPPWQVANNQGFDNNGNYYNSDYTGGKTSDPVDGTPIVWEGIAFPIGPVPTEDSQVGGSKGPKNVVHAAGQTINLPVGSFDWLYLAGAGANGNQLSQHFTLNFTDGTTETWTQSFTDWGNNGTTTKPIPFAGESVIREQPNRINQLGNTVNLATYVYGYTHHIPKGKTLASLTLPNNNNLGILSVVGATEPPTNGAEVKSFVLGRTNLTGTDLVTLKINNQQSDPLTFSIANWPLNGCDPTTTTCNYSVGNLTVTQNQTRTVTYIAPSSYTNMGFSVQKADRCVANCSTYIPDWSAGVHGTSCSTLNPSPGQTMAPGQTWTIYVQNQFTGYNGFLDGPGMPGSQNSNKYPNGCVFAMNTAFQNWIANQPGWAKWLEGIVGVVAAIGITFLTFGTPDFIAALFTSAEEESTILIEDGVVDEEVANKAETKAGSTFRAWSASDWYAEHPEMFNTSPYVMPWTQ